jgi:drug/metabolite transporter (DMT)-like permease
MTTTNKWQQWLLPIGMVISMSLWGLSWSSGKVLAIYGPPIEITFYRFFSTSIALFILMWLTKKKPNDIHIKNGFWVVLVSAVLLIIYTVLFFYILKQGKAGLSGIIVTESNPFIAYLIFILLNLKLPQYKELIGLLIGLLGGFVLLYADWNGTELPLQYIVLLFGASFTWAILSLFTAQSKKFAHPIIFTFYLYLLASIFLLFLSDMQQLNYILFHSDGLFWFNLFFSSFFTTALATTFYFYATTQLGAHKASVYILIVPFAAAIGAALFLGETLHLNEIIGGLMGLLAIYLIQRK